MSARLTGLREMRDAFDAFGQDFDDGTLRRLARRIGTRDARLACDKAPRDDGGLRKAIKCVGPRPAAARRAHFTMPCRSGLV